MFKRGAQLPARPPIPNKDEILNDLNNACAHDVLYLIKEQTPAEGSKGSKISCDDYDLMDFDPVPTTSYLLIDSFLNQMRNLKDYLIILSEQKANLRRLEENLLEDMNNIKKELNSKSTSLT